MNDFILIYCAILIRLTISTLRSRYDTITQWNRQCAMIQSKDIPSINDLLFAFVFIDIKEHKKPHRVINIIRRRRNCDLNSQNHT